jgi:catechol 2,3-dioxygenase-like lactoylglutathione lyase family enzyme
MNLSDVTPNLIVSDIERSTAFYRDTLGFSVVTSVPEQAPFAFVWMRRGTVSVFLNALSAAKDDLPEWGSRPIGGTNAMFITIDAENVEQGVDALFRAVENRARVVMPLKDQFYGMREFAIEDPDGYVLFFAQRLGAG